VTDHFSGPPPAPRAGPPSNLVTGNGADPYAARILDRGYRRYEGERRGVRSSIRSLVVHSVLRGFGMRRTFWAKILPLLAVGIAYIPAIVFIGLVATLGNERITSADIPTYGQYYGNIVSAIIVFVAFVAPEVLCTDRRTGMLGMYLSSPLTRDTYLISKALAIAAVLGAVCLGPPLLMLVAFVLQGNGPSSFGDLLLTFGRIILAGVCITMFFTALSIAVSSFTDRKALASASVILLVLLSAAMTGALVDGAGGGRGLYLLNVALLPFELATRIHGELSVNMYPVSTGAVWAAWAAWTIAAALLARWRYQRLQVVR
jgi:ABC-2 type transport system permease protein